MVAASSLLHSQQPKVSAILRSTLLNRSSILSRRHTRIVDAVAPSSSNSSISTTTTTTTTTSTSWPSSSTRPSSTPSSIHGFAHQSCQLRYYASSHSVFGKASGMEEGSSSELLHSMYHDQMREIESEREALFGVSDDTSLDGPDLSRTAKAYFTPDEDFSGVAKQPPQSQQPPSSPMPPSTSSIPSTPLPPHSNNPTPPNWNAESAKAEREELYGFSEEEKTAWSNTANSSGTEKTVSHIRRIRQLRKATTAYRADGTADEMETLQSNEPPSSSSSSAPSTVASPFSHLTPQGDGVSMVDVGRKSPSRRVAVARSTVVFPPEVLSAFRLDDEGRGVGNTEMIGPKGPIFETAKIAGIMGAKKTSDLIPLCHPLPLDRVNITIRLVNNTAVIECECTVTHKTGVEMEALTGASIAALTIYDMVKAVSHGVEIGRTVLVGKSGGKSDYVREDDGSVEG